MNPPERRHGPLQVALRGFAMGSADLVPGVSGGTLALVLGIYARLVASLGALTRAGTWAALRRGDLRSAWRAVDGPFLLALAVGIGAALLTLSSGLSWLLEHRRAGLYAVFFGLIAASAPLVYARARRPRPALVAWAAAGALATFLFVGATPGTTPDGPAFLALSGAIAVSALLLPGVSGSFILVLLGKYETVLGALSGLDLAVLAPFALGMAAGLLLFARLLDVLLSRLHDPMMGLLAGVLVGSLRKVWPWQVQLGEATVNVAPPDALAVASALALAAAGAAAVWALARAGAAAGE